MQYEVIEHRPDYSAEQTALDTHTAAAEFAKTIILRVGSSHALAVLPAAYHVDLRAVREQLGRDDVELASEEETARAIPDCELGAAPPFGSLYGLDVYYSPRFAHCERVTFNAGSHRVAIRVTRKDFERLIGGRELGLAKIPGEDC